MIFENFRKFDFFIIVDPIKQPKTLVLKPNSSFKLAPNEIIFGQIDRATLNLCRYAFVLWKKIKSEYDRAFLCKKYGFFGQEILWGKANSSFKLAPNQIIFSANDYANVD